MSNIPVGFKVCGRCGGTGSIMSAKVLSRTMELSRGGLVVTCPVCIGKRTMPVLRPAAVRHFEDEEETIG